MDPAAPPPPPEDHADMRRLRGMIEAGVLRAGDEVVFELKASRYVATLSANGSLLHRRAGAASHAASAASAAATPPPEVYTSLSDWANTMLKRYNTKRSARSRARTRILVNGWMDCTVGGRSLRELRFGHMRDSKIAASLRDASESPTAPFDQREAPPSSDAAQPPAREKTPPRVDERKPKDNDDTRHAHAGDKPGEKPRTNPDAKVEDKVDDKLSGHAGAKAGTNSGAKASSDLRPKADVKADVKADAKADATVDASADLKAPSKADAKAGAKVNVEARAGPEDEAGVTPSARKRLVRAREEPPVAADLDNVPVGTMGHSRASSCGMEKSRAGAKPGLLHESEEIATPDVKDKPEDRSGVDGRTSEGVSKVRSDVSLEGKRQQREDPKPDAVRKDVRRSDAEVETAAELNLTTVRDAGESGGSHKPPDKASADDRGKDTDVPMKGAEPGPHGFARRDVGLQPNASGGTSPSALQSEAKAKNRDGGNAGLGATRDIGADGTTGRTGGLIGKRSQTEPSDERPVGGFSKADDSLNRKVGSARVDKDDAEKGHGQCRGSPPHKRARNAEQHDGDKDSVAIGSQRPSGEHRENDTDTKRGGPQTTEKDKSGSGAATEFQARGEKRGMKDVAGPRNEKDKDSVEAPSQARDDDSHQDSSGKLEKASPPKTGSSSIVTHEGEAKSQSVGSGRPRLDSASGLSKDSGARGASGTNASMQKDDAKRTESERRDGAAPLHPATDGNDSGDPGGGKKGPESKSGRIGREEKRVGSGDGASNTQRDSELSSPPREGREHSGGMDLRAKAFDAASDSDSVPARKRGMRKKPSSSDESLDKAIEGTEKERTPSSVAGEEPFEGSDKDVRWRKKSGPAGLALSKEGSDDVRVQKGPREIEASDDATAQKGGSKGRRMEGHVADSKVQTSASDDGMIPRERGSVAHEKDDACATERSHDARSTASGRDMDTVRRDEARSDSRVVEDNERDGTGRGSAPSGANKRQRESGTDADDSADEPISKRQRGDSHNQWSLTQARKQRRVRANRASSRAGDEESESNDDKGESTLRSSRRTRPSRRQALAIAGLTDFQGLEDDPAAAEAAAVAAAAEKEEAISRGRRTTRLAAGKIKQVDYKASAIPSRGTSADRLGGTDDAEDSEIDRDEKSAPAPTRSSMRQRTSSHRTSRVSSRRAQDKGDHSGSEAVTEKHGSSDGVDGRRFGSVGSGGSRNGAQDVHGRSSSVHGTRKGGSGSGSGSSGNASLSRRDVEEAVALDDNGVGRDFGDSGSHAGEKGDGADLIADVDGSKDSDHVLSTNGDDHADDDEDKLSGKDGVTGISTDSRGALSKGGSKGSRKRAAAQRDTTGLDEDDDLSAELNAISGEEEGEPRDEDGWSVAELSAIAKAVKSSGSLDARTVFSAICKANSSWSSTGRTEDDVSQYLNSVTSVIRELCPRTPSAASSEAGIRVNDMLSFIAAEVWRLVSGVQRPAGEVAKQVRKEIRLRAALDKSKRKLKRDLEDARVKLDAEMELRRKVSYEGACLLLRVGDYKRMCDREVAARRKTMEEIDLYKKREQDARERTDRIKTLAGQLRGERVPDDEETAFGVLAEDAMEVDSGPVLPGSGGRANRKSRETRSKDGGSGGSGTSVEMEDAPVADDDVDAIAAENTQEVRRLYALIATYEAEAEKNQRLCEAERVRVNALLENKNKLENDLYMHKNPTGGGSPGAGTGRQSRDSRRADGTSRGGPSGRAGASSSLPSRKASGKVAAGSDDIGGAASVSAGVDALSAGRQLESSKAADGSKPVSRRKGLPMRSPQA